MWPSQRRAGHQASSEALEHAGAASHRGGAGPTLISAFALIFSGFSFYESVVKAPNISLFVPPQIAYVDPDRPDSPLEVFIIPLTLANNGARSGTVLSIDLSVTNKRTSQTKHFYSAQIGQWTTKTRAQSAPLTPTGEPYAPVALAGRAAYSGAIQFFPRDGETVPRILDLEPGDYSFEITINLAAVAQPRWFPSSEPQPLRFDMKAGRMDYRNFLAGATLPLWSPGHRPTSSNDTQPSSEQ